MSLVLISPLTRRSTGPLRIGGASAASGSALTTFQGRRAVVWLLGDIDMQLEAELNEIADSLTSAVDHLVVDASRVTFCDSTLNRFLIRVAGLTPVTLRRPSRLLADYLRVTGLTSRLILT